MTDAAFWGVAWAVFAAAAGVGLTVAAIARSRRVKDADAQEFTACYNALAPLLRRSAPSA